MCSRITVSSLARDKTTADYVRTLRVSIFIQDMAAPHLAKQKQAEAELKEERTAKRAEAEKLRVQKEQQQAEAAEAARALKEAAKAEGKAAKKARKKKRTAEKQQRQGARGSKAPGVPALLQRSCSALARRSSPPAEPKR